MLLVTSLLSRAHLHVKSLVELELGTFSIQDRKALAHSQASLEKLNGLQMIYDHFGDISLSWGSYGSPLSSADIRL